MFRLCLTFQRPLDCSNQGVEFSLRQRGRHRLFNFGGWSVPSEIQQSVCGRAARGSDAGPKSLTPVLTQQYNLGFEHGCRLREIILVSSRNRGLSQFPEFCSVGESTKGVSNFRGGSLGQRQDFQVATERIHRIERDRAIPESQVDNLEFRQGRDD